MIVITDGVIQVNAYQAELNGRVNPQGENLVWWFEYDIDSLFSSSEVTPQVAMVAGSVSNQVSFVVSKLAPGTAYYYRLYAQSLSGTVVGGMRVLKTGLVVYNDIELMKNDEKSSRLVRPTYRDFNQFSPDKSPSLYDVACIGQGVNNILTCRPGSRFFKNGFGSEIDDLVFELNNDNFAERALGYLIDPIAMWEPRARIVINASTILQSYDVHVVSMNVGFSTVLDEKRVFQMGVKGVNRNDK